MQTMNLYRYTRPNGGITVSTIMPDTEYTALYRLIADEGMILTDGIIKTSCIDTEDTSVWTEIKDTETSDGIHDNNISELNAEIIEKARAYDILMGMSE